MYNDTPQGDAGLNIPLLISLNGWDQYNLLSAVRGPDMGNRGTDVSFDVGDMKRLFTQRVRGIVFTTGEVPGDWTDRAMSFAQVLFAVKLICSLRQAMERDYLDRGTGGIGHFLFHLAYAVQVSRDHKVWGGFGRILAQALSGHNPSWSKYEFMGA